MFVIYKMHKQLVYTQFEISFTIRVATNTKQKHQLYRDKPMKPLLLSITTLLAIVLLPSLTFANHHELKSSDYKSEEAYNKSIMQIAMSAAPSNVSGKATIMGSNGEILREGTNGWTCMPGTPPNENFNPMCVDKAWRKWLDAFVNKKPYDSESASFGLSYMLVGDVPVDNDDPNNTDPTKGTRVQEGPHLMILLPASMMKDFPRDPYAGGPYVMFDGSEYVHMMVPLTTLERPE